MVSRCSALVCCGLAVLAASVYAQAAGFGFQVFDDGKYVSQNTHVARGLTWENIRWAFSTFTLSNWHPLTWLSFMLDVEVWGPGPRGCHITNIAWHALNTVLVFLLLNTLTGQSGRAAVVAALFAVHPQHVESVAWISERKDVLSTAWGLLCLLAYTRYARQGGAIPYVAALVAYLLSLLSKQMLITLPALLLLLDSWPLRRWSGTSFPTGRLLWEKAPFGLLAVGFAVVILAAQEAGGAVQDLESYPLTLRVANAVLAYGLYLWKLCVPYRLAAFYPHPGERIEWPAVGLSAVGLWLLTMAAWRQRGRRPYLLTGWLWFLVTLLPVIGLVQVGNQQLADRYTYVPHLGLLVAGVWLFADLAREREWPRALSVIAALLVVGLATIRCRDQVSLWRTETSMLQHTIEVTGGSHFAHHNLGVAHSRAGRQQEAVIQYRLALEFRPGSMSTHYALGNALQALGDYAAAASHYQAALTLNPQLAEAYNNLGLLQLRLGRIEQARVLFETALQIDPELSKAAENLRLAEELARRARERALPIPERAKP